MAQQVIDGILYSPVLAHALRRGDLMISADTGDAYRLTANPTLMREREQDVPFLRAAAVDAEGFSTQLTLWVNESVLRAVGAGVGGIA